LRHWHSQQALTISELGLGQADSLRFCPFPAQKTIEIHGSRKIQLAFSIAGLEHVTISAFVSEPLSS